MAKWESAFLEWQPQFELLARRLQDVSEPAFAETVTVQIWKEFLQAEQIPHRYGLQGKAPIIDVGSFAEATYKIVVTADLDAVGRTQGDGWVCEQSCGHFAQSVHALGLAKVLSEYGVPNGVAVRIIGCPGEECRPVYDANYPLPYLGGKQQLLAEGWFAKANIVLATHLADGLPTRAVQIVEGVNGMIGIRCKHHSTSDCGAFRQAWQAALRAITSYDQLSVTERQGGAGLELWAELPRRKEKYYIPVHVLFQEVAKRHGISAELICEYAPLRQNRHLQKRVADVLKYDQEHIQPFHIKWLPGATDLGDVSQLYPTFQLFVGGTKGMTHTSEFHIVDPEFALFWPIEWLWRMVLSFEKNPLN